jgi:DNA-directed RNA polymerase specialized sigma24 family protein
LQAVTMIAKKAKSKKAISDEDKRFHELMRQVRLGSEDAVRELLDLYGKHIIHVVRRRLHREMRSKFDSQDFVQAVWASFFTKPCLNASFENPKKLIVFLAEVASNKVIEEWRKRYKINKLSSSALITRHSLRSPSNCR